jgi:hypothetical protein
VRHPCSGCNHGPAAVQAWRLPVPAVRFTGPPAVLGATQAQHASLPGPSDAHALTRCCCAAVPLVLQLLGARLVVSEDLAVVLDVKGARGANLCACVQRVTGEELRLGDEAGVFQAGASQPAPGGRALARPVQRQESPTQPPTHPQPQPPPTHLVRQALVVVLQVELLGPIGTPRLQVVQRVGRATWWCQGGGGNASWQRPAAQKLGARLARTCMPRTCMACC